VASASVTRDEEAPVSRTALAKLSLGPFTAVTITVARKDIWGGDVVAVVEGGLGSRWSIE